MNKPLHPGIILKEAYLEPLNITITAFAEAIGVTRNSISSIVNGRFGISPEIALKLSIALSDTSPEYWLNLQQQYDLWLARQSFETSNIRVIKKS